VLTTARLLLRPLRQEDLAPLDAIVREPEVARFWTSPARDLLASGAETTVLAVERRDTGETIGAIQYDEAKDDEYPRAGIDLFLSSRAHGQGLGQEALRAVVKHLFEVGRHHRITIDPLVANVRAVRCYERVGFRHVGVMRRYQRMSDGRYEDGALMELLADDEDREADVPFLLSRMVAFNREEGIDWDPARGEAPLRRLLADPSLGRVVVVKDGGERVGYAVVTYGYDLEFGGRDAFLTELWIDAGARGRGLARRVLDDIVADLRAKGFGALHLQVRAENAEARRLYAAAGFDGTTRVFLSKRIA
jgi:aminoglycoside 6'-N-acetyltransferase